MKLSRIKKQLQKNIIGRFVITIYHSLVGKSIFKFNKFKYRFVKNKIKKMKFYSIEQTFDLLESSYSISRFGDGEIAWIYQDSKEAFGQENSKELSLALMKALLSHEKKLLIGIPGYFGNHRNYTPRFVNASKAHLAVYGKRWMKILNSNTRYADALITRPYFGFDKKTYSYIFSRWKRLWDNKDILIVEGRDTKFGIGNDLLSNAKSISRIICPSENAFSMYKTIYQKTINKATGKIILIALGPTATVLSYELSHLGIQAIDIGHLDIEYEWYKHKAKSKTPVRGKYVNESGGKPLQPIAYSDMRIYKSQIIDEC